MLSFRMSSFVLLMLCSSQIFCVPFPDESENPPVITEFEEEEVASSPPEGESTTEEIAKQVPTVRMPANSDVSNSESSSDSTASMQTQEFYPGQVEIWPKKVSNPTYDIQEMKAICQDNKLDMYLEFGTPFKGYVYPYHHFKRCHLYTGSGETGINLLVDKDSCGLDIIYESHKGGIKFMTFTLMVQWNRDFMSQWDRKIRITCNRKENDQNDNIVFNTNDNTTFEAEIRMYIETETEDESKVDSSDPAAYDPVQIGENVEISFSVNDTRRKQSVDAQVVKCTACDDFQIDDKQEIKTYGINSESQIIYDGNLPLLTDGCPKDATMFSEFKKEKIDSSSVFLRNSFKVFRFPSSPFLFVLCSVRVCRDECPPQQDCSSQLKTAVAEESPDHKVVKLFRPLMVRSPMGGFSIMDEHHDDTGKVAVREGVPTASFIAGLIGMGFICAIVCVFMYKRFKKGTEKDYKMQYSPNAEKNKDEVAPLKVTTATTD